MADLLLRVPESLAWNLLVNWLYVGDVARVDSAYCSRKHRLTFCSTAFAATVYHNGHIGLAWKPNDIKIAYLKWLLRRQVHIGRFDVPVEQMDRVNLFQPYFMSLGASLKSINLRAYVGCGICNHVIRFAARNCPNLLELSISSCQITSSPADFECLLKSCTLLRNLSFTSCTATIHIASGKHVFNVIAANCAHLEILEWDDCGLDNSAIQALARHSCCALKRLSLSCNEQLTDTALVQLLSHCPCLTELELTRCRDLTCLTICAVAEHCPLLQRLVIDHLPRVSNPSLVALQNNSKNLRYLSVVGCAFSGAAVSALQASNKQLVVKCKPNYPALSEYVNYYNYEN